MSKAHIGILPLCGYLFAAAAIATSALGADRPAKAQRQQAPSQSDRQAISVLGADRNVMDSNLRSQRAMIEREMVSSSCQSLYNITEFASKAGIDAVKARLDQCRSLNQDDAKLVRDHWLAWQDRLQRDNVPKGVSEELLKSLSKAHPRFLEKQTAALAAADAHTAGVVKLIAFAEKIVGKLKTQGPALIVPAASNDQFTTLKNETDALRVTQLRAERVLDAQTDGAFYMLQCAIDGHSATTTPNLQYCVLKARSTHALEQLLKDLDRVLDAPLQNSLDIDSLPDKLMSSEGLAGMRQLFNEIKMRDTNSVLVIEYSFAELENALSDAEVAPTDMEILNQKSESVRATRAAIDARYAARMELSATLDHLAVFFASNMGRIKKKGPNTFIFSTQAQYAEFTKIMARCTAAVARVQELENESTNKVGRMKDLVTT